MFYVYVYVYVQCQCPDMSLYMSNAWHMLKRFSYPILIIDRVPSEISDKNRTLIVLYYCYCYSFYDTPGPGVRQ